MIDSDSHVFLRRDRTSSLIAHVLLSMIIHVDAWQVIKTGLREKRVNDAIFENRLIKRYNNDLWLFNEVQFLSAMMNNGGSYALAKYEV